VAAPTTIAGAKVLDGEIAAQKALASIRHGEGPRIGFLGDPGCGKTEAMKHFIAMYLRSSNGIVIIVDDKEPAGSPFSGQIRRDVADLEARPPDPAGPRVILLRGEPGRGVYGRVDREAVPALQWRLAQKRRPSLAVYDELNRACNGGQWVANPSEIAYSFTAGRSSGIGNFWGLQQTQTVPPEPFDCSTHIIVVRCVGNPVRLLKARGYCEGGADKIIPQLPGDELPKPERGYFALLERGRPWDGCVYRFRKRAAQPAPTG
jgi:hypothetical protein